MLGGGPRGESNRLAVDAVGPRRYHNPSHGPGVFTLAGDGKRRRANG